MDPIKSHELEMVTRLQAHKTNMIQTRSTITGGELFHHNTSHTKQTRRTNIRAGGAKPPVIVRTFKLLGRPTPWAVGHRYIHVHELNAGITAL
jgi:hypothetical protein